MRTVRKSLAVLALAPLLAALTTAPAIAMPSGTTHAVQPVRKVARADVTLAATAPVPAPAAPRAHGLRTAVAAPSSSSPGSAAVVVAFLLALAGIAALVGRAGPVPASQIDLRRWFI